MLTFRDEIFKKLQLGCLAVLLGCLPSLAFGQIEDYSAADISERSTQTIYFEALGNGLIYSLNFDNLIAHNGRSGLSSRFGLSFYPVFGTTDFPKIVVPIELNYLSGGERMFEVGLGASFSDYGNHFWPSLRIGYRRQPVDGGFFFRFGFLLGRIVYGDDGGTNKQILPSIGLGFGYSAPRK